MAGRLDLLPDALVVPSAAWHLLPLSALLTYVLVFLRHTWCSTVLALLISLAALGLVAAVMGSPLGVGLGAQVAVVTGSLPVAGALMAVVARSRGRRRERRGQRVDGT